MPWHITSNHSGCPSSRPWAVVKDADGSVSGCHPTEDAAKDQLAALYAAEADEETDTMSTQTEETLGGKPNPGTPPDKRLKENDGCPPGQHRGRGGDCVDDAMSLDDVEELAADVVDELEGPLLGWEGVLAVEGVETGDGREFVPGSLEWPDLEDVIVPLMWQERSEPQHVRSVMVGRIQEVWRVGDQVWGRGIIKRDTQVVEDMRHGLAGGISVDVDSVRDHDVEFVYDDNDDEDVSVTEDGDNIIMLFGPEPSKVRFHRGRLRGATLVALPAFIEARINLTDDEGDGLVAAAIPIDPPHEWFADPQLTGPTPWTITDDGHVLGHMALWSTCHQTFPDRCITPPRESDFPYFMRRELKTAEGEVIGVGPITMGTGHAATRLGARPAAAHYDNTGTAVCDVVVGRDRFGIWISGALRPGLTPLQLRELRGAALSGDWRRIGGQLRLVAVLAVNVPGFPIPRMASYATDAQAVSLVAAGIVTEQRAERVREAIAHMGEDGTIRVRRIVRETAVPA